MARRLLVDGREEEAVSETDTSARTSAAAGSDVGGSS